MKVVHAQSTPRPEGVLTNRPNSATAAPIPGNPDAGLTDGGVVTKPAPSGTIQKPSKSLARKYSDLKKKYWDLLRNYQQLQSPSRTQEQIEDQLSSIKRFYASMGSAEGAVTAANMYGKDFWTSELDSKYRVALLTWLTTKFSHDEPLIVAAYNMWTRLLEKEGHAL